MYFGADSTSSTIPGAQNILIAANTGDIATYVV